MEGVTCWAVAGSTATHKDEKARILLANHLWSRIRTVGSGRFVGNGSAVFDAREGQALSAITTTAGSTDPAVYRKAHGMRRYDYR